MKAGEMFNLKGNLIIKHPNGNFYKIESTEFNTTDYNNLLNKFDIGTARTNQSLLDMKFMNYKYDGML